MKRKGDFDRQAAKFLKLVYRRLLLVPVVALALGQATRAPGDNDTWKAAVPGFFNDGSKWTDGTAPGQFDWATFNVSGKYTVTFAASRYTSALFVKQGNVTFESGGGPFVYSAGGTQVTGGSLTLGNSGKPLNLVVNEIGVQTGGTLNVKFGSILQPNPYGAGVFVGTSGPGSTGTLVVDGSMVSVSVPDLDVSVGADGATGNLIFQNSATSDELNYVTVASSGAGSVGNLTVQSGSTISMHYLTAGAGGEAGQSATVTVDGPGSSIEVSSQVLGLGADANSTATLNVNNGGTFTIPYSELMVNRTATVNLGGGTLDVSWMTIDGGALNCSSNGVFTGQEITIQNGGRASFTGDYSQPRDLFFTVKGPGSKLETTSGGSLTLDGSVYVRSGGLLSSAAGLNIGTSSYGTLDLSGGSSLITGGDATLGTNGFDASLFIQDGSIAAVGGDLNVASTVTGGIAYLSVSYGSSLQADDIRVGSGGVAGQFGEIDVSEGSITQTPGSMLTVGASDQSSGKLYISTGGCFTAGAGTMLNPTGAIEIYDGEADLKALTFNGGSIDFYSGSLSFTGDLHIGQDALRTPVDDWEIWGPSPLLDQEDIVVLRRHELSLTGTTTVDAFAALMMEGGYLETGALAVDGGLYFNRGAIVVGGPGGLTVGDGGPLGGLVTLGSDEPVSLYVVADTTVNSRSQLNVHGGRLATSALINSGTTTLTGGGISVGGTVTVNPGANLSIDGGTLTAAALVNAGTFALDGSLSHVATGLSNEVTGLLLIGQTGMINVDGAASNAGDLVLGGGAATLFGTGTLTNTGVIRGEGRISKPVTNAAGGEIRAENGKLIKLEGTNGANQGKINLQGGTAEFTQVLCNGPSGDVLGRGTLLSGGLSNQGDIALSSGITDVFGHLSNDPGGRIIISGNADVTFWDDVTNGGALFKVSGGSSATFFGALSGAGISGSGDVFVEDDVTPGFSPGVANFGGNLVFGSTANLQIELDGPDHDQINVAGNVYLDGTLTLQVLRELGEPGEYDRTIITTAAEDAIGGDFHTKPAEGEYLGCGVFLDGYRRAALQYDLNLFQAAVGDADGDCDVDLDDLSLLDDGWDPAGTLLETIWTNGDFDFDGDVDLDDLSCLDDNWSPAGYATGGPGGLLAPGGATAVPEPGTLLLLVIGLVGLWMVPRVRRCTVW